MALMNVVILLLIISITNSLMFAEALKCYQCGSYTDGAGSITPCLNYTEQTAPFYLKDCPRSSNAYCIVSVASPFLQPPPTFRVNLLLHVCNLNTACIF